MDAVRICRLAVRVEAVFGHKEERNAAGSLGCAGGARENEVDDIVGEIMLAKGDEDFLALDPVQAGVLALGDLFGGRAQRADIAARSGLGQVHRAVPRARHEVREPGLALFLGAIGHQRVDRAGCQDVAQGKAHVGGAERFDDHCCQREGQALSAIGDGTVDAAPAGVDELLIGFLEARRHGDLAVRPFGVGHVADAVERRIDPGCELADAGNDRLDHVGGRVGEFFMGRHRVDACDMIEDEELFGDRRCVGHGTGHFAGKYRCAGAIARHG